MAESELVSQWQTIVQVQMHFNDMLLTTRSICISAVLAAYGAATVSIAQYPRKSLKVFEKEFHVSVPITMFAIILLVGIFVLDFFYYYELLIGAVDIGEMFERANPNIVHIAGELSDRVSRIHANTVILIFYGVPAVMGLVLLIYAWQKLPTHSD